MKTLQWIKLFLNMIFQHAETIEFVLDNQIKRKKFETPR